MNDIDAPPMDRCVECHRYAKLSSERCVVCENGRAWQNKTLGEKIRHDLTAAVFIAALLSFWFYTWLLRKLGLWPPTQR